MSIGSIAKWKRKETDKVVLRIRFRKGRLPFERVPKDGEIVAVKIDWPIHCDWSRNLTDLNALACI